MLELPLEKRIDAFQILGAKLTAWLLAYHENRNAGKTDSNDPLLRLVREQVSNNPWFVEEQIIRALKEWAFLLNTKDLTEWTSALNERTDSKRIALIPAGNIPLVGFHDVLSVLISGHSLLLRPSSDDPALIPLLLLMLEEVEPAFKERIRIADGRLQNFDAVIATGSNNSARYFNHYFGKYPHIIRKNRTSVALLNGSETEEDLKGLADDVMAYFGLGCRSVTKVFMPQDFDLDRIFGQLYHYRHYLNCKPFADNYDYHRSLWMMNSIPFLENGFMLVREEASIHSPVSALHYERYENLDQVKQELLDREEELQMVVGKDVDFFPRTSGLGRGQMPALDDYADGVDTLKFLNDL